MADVFGTENPDVLDGLDGVTDFGDRIYGLGGNDEIYGLGGRDLLVGGAGADYLDGGADLDIADYSASPLAVFVSLTGGGVGGDANGDIYVSVEDIIGSDFDDFLVGDGNNNFINGIGGNNTIQGGGGDDQLNAYQGNDNISGGDGNDRIFSSSGSDSLDGGAGNDDLSGSVGDDILAGGDGDDTLDGGEDADKLDGGVGTDLADYSSVFSSTPLVINLTAGTASDGDTLSGIENVTGSSGANTIYGDGGGNVLNGGGGNDVLSGLAGNDTLLGGVGDDVVIGFSGGDALDGGDGTDRAYYTSSNAAVTVNLETGAASGGHAQGDTLINIEGIVGSLFNDALTGSEVGANRLSGYAGNDAISGLGGDDYLEGGDGNDVLSGGLGADFLRGDAGTDRADYAGSNAAVTVNLTAGNGSGGHAQGDRYLGIEDVYGSGFADALLGDAASNRLLGQNGNDLLSGGIGNDVLNGGAGADEIYGGVGVDTADYAGSNAAVQVNLTVGTAAGGHAAGDVLALIENLSGSSLNDTLAGTESANALGGGDGNDVLSGRGGNDALVGAAGDDRLFGEVGDDVLTGGAGRDLLTGGGGNDRFDYNALGESTPGAQRDAIYDFAVDPAANAVFIDRIDVAAIDARAGLAGDQAFAFIGGGAFSAEGQIRATQAGFNTLLQFNSSGASGAEMEILLINFTAANLSAADFIL